MNLLDLSIRSVLRKPVKNILLLFIVFVVASFIYAGFTCKNASIQTQDKGRQAVGASFRMERNEANRKKGWMNYQRKLGVIKREVWTDITKNNCLMVHG